MAEKFARRDYKELLATIPEAQAGINIEHAVTPAGLSAFLDGISDLYYLKLKRMFGTSLIGLWPLSELSGLVSVDISGKGNNGVSNNLALGYSGIGDGKTCAYFNTDPNYVNLLSTGLISAFNGAEGSALFWGRAFSTGIWSEAVIRYFLHLRGDLNNHVKIYKSATPNQVVIKLRGTATEKTFTLTGINPGLSNFNFGFTWSYAANEAKAYYYGNQQDATQTGLGVWVGALQTALVGDYAVDAGMNPWIGFMAYVALLNRPGTNAEMLKAATL
jgi:hypothetical protein